MHVNRVTDEVVNRDVKRQCKGHYKEHSLSLLTLLSKKEKLQLDVKTEKRILSHVRKLRRSELAVRFQAFI